jgi:MYXO-CTERM domain-containing protein
MNLSSKRRSALLAFAATMLTAPAVLANGRFPRAEHLFESPTDPNKLTLSATYGLLTTDDRGKHWFHVCETAFSYQAMYVGDPFVGLTADESLLVGTEQGLAISHDRGCDWTPSLSGQSMTQSFFDLTTSPMNRNDILALSTTVTGGKPVNQIQESTDGGATWKPIGTPLPAAIVYTIDVDPHDPNHIYATGLTDTSDAPDTGVFLSSSDHAATWTTNPIPNTYAWASPYIAAIHPTDSNKIFVRTSAWKNRDVVETADDFLLYSADGGKTWTELLHPGGPDPDSPGAQLFGFALSPDGSTAVAGYGDAVEGSRLLERSVQGIYKSSSDGKYTFGSSTSPPSQFVAGQISCLTWTKTGIYACVTPDGEVSYLGFSKDLAFTALDQMTILMRLPDTVGVPQCCNGRAVTTCNWAVDCAVLGACADGGMSRAEAPVCTPDGGGAGGSGGSTGTGPGAGAAGAPAEPAKSGCGCRTVGEPSSESAKILGLLLMAGACRRRRRTARLSHTKSERSTRDRGGAEHPRANAIPSPRVANQTG